MGLNIGITGGIGSGKSLVCRIFSVLGISVYDADQEAKALMNTHPDLIGALKNAFGDQVYDAEGQLNRAYLAAEVFGDQQKLNRLNSIVHPIVIQAGVEWMNAQAGPYSGKEGALLFESGSHQANDYNILVFAPTEERINRVMARDRVSKEQVLARMEKQMPEEEKMNLADFVIYNDGTQALIPQVLELHSRFLDLYEEKSQFD